MLKQNTKNYIDVEKLRQALHHIKDNQYLNIFKVLNRDTSSSVNSLVFRTLIRASSKVEKNEVTHSKKIPLNIFSKYAWLIIELPLMDIMEAKSLTYQLLSISPTYISNIEDTTQIGFYFPNSPQSHVFEKEKLTYKYSNKYILFCTIERALYNKFKNNDELSCCCKVTHKKRQYQNPYIGDFYFLGNYFELKSFKKIYDDYMHIVKPHSKKPYAKKSFYEQNGNKHMNQEEYRKKVKACQEESGRKTSSKKTSEDYKKLAKISSESKIYETKKKIRDIVTYIIKNTPKNKTPNLTPYNIHKESKLYTSTQELNKLKKNEKALARTTIIKYKEYIQEITH